METNPIKVLQALSPSNELKFLVVDLDLLRFVKPTKALVYALFAQKFEENDGNEFNLPIKEICKILNMDRGAIIDSIAFLEKEGLIKKYRRGMDPNNYYSVMSINLLSFIKKMKAEKL